MAECNWDPKKHGNKPCPVHGSGGGKVTQKDGKFYREMDDKTVRVASTREELYEEPATPEQLKSEFNDLLKEGLSEEEAVKKMLDDYNIPEDEVNELFGVEMSFDDDYDFDNWEEEPDESEDLDFGDEEEFDDFEYEPDDDGVSVDDRELIEDKVREQIKQNKVKSIGELRQILQKDTKINQLTNGELNAMIRRIKRGR